MIPAVFPPLLPPWSQKEALNFHPLHTQLDGGDARPRPLPRAHKSCSIPGAARGEGSLSLSPPLFLLLPYQYFKVTAIISGRGSAHCPDGRAFSVTASVFSYLRLGSAKKMNISALPPPFTSTAVCVAPLAVSQVVSLFMRRCATDSAHLAGHSWGGVHLGEISNGFSAVSRSWRAADQRNSTTQRGGAATHFLIRAARACPFLEVHKNAPFLSGEGEKTASSNKKPPFPPSSLLFSSY